MDAVEKGQDLEQRKAAMLAAMGVQVWYKRSASAVQVPAAPEAPTTEQNRAPTPQPGRSPQPSQTPTAPVALPAPELIEFSWIKGNTGMIVCPLAIDRATGLLLRDILVYGDWLQGQANAKISRGEFRWPQLLDTTGGTPIRALTVFIDKHLSADNVWIGVTPEIAPSLTKWLAQLPIKVIALPSLQNSIGDASTKKAIWTALKHKA